MTRMILFAFVAMTTTVHAAPCPGPDATLAACRQKTLHDIGAETSLETDPQDQPMVAYRPVSPPALHPKLVLIFHGHPGPRTTGFSEFQHVAADLGMYSISLDDEFSGNPDNTPADTCSANLGTSSTCDNGHHAVCGCYAHCYGDFDMLQWKGVGHDGLPDPIAGTPNHLHYVSIEYRLASYLEWLVAQPGGAGWGAFLDGNGDIIYDDIILAGLSRGSSTAGYIAKHVKADRVLLFSGPSDQTVSDGASGTDSAHPTTYRWGVANGVGSCTESTNAAFWIADNDFFGNTGTAWQTRKLFRLGDKRDPHFLHVTNAGLLMGVMFNDTVLGMPKRHDPGFPDQWYDIGSWLLPDHGYTAGHYKALLSDEMCSSGTDGGHVETVADGGCDLPAEITYRHKLWTYMLTSP